MHARKVFSRAPVTSFIYQLVRFKSTFFFCPSTVRPNTTACNLFTYLTSVCCRMTPFPRRTSLQMSIACSWATSALGLSWTTSSLKCKYCVSLCSLCVVIITFSTSKEYGNSQFKMSKKITIDIFFSQIICCFFHTCSLDRKIWFPRFKPDPFIH